MADRLGDILSGALEEHDVSPEPCDDCGVRGQSKLYVDMHVFQLCAACAWRLTAEYHADGLRAPWEGAG